MAMWIGASGFAGKAGDQALQSRWLDGAVALMAPPGPLAIAFTLLSAPSDWARGAFISGALFLMIAARARSAAMGCSPAAAARMENSMKTRVGLWIDHRKAVLVAVTGTGEEIRLIHSNVEKQVRPSGGTRSRAPYGAQDAPPDDMRERAFMGHLNVYFDKVISCTSNAESILVFGPGEAKLELKKRIEGNPSLGRIVVVETADRMSDRQVMAHVRRRFQLPGRKPRLNRREGFPGGGRASRLPRPVQKMGLSPGFRFHESSAEIALSRSNSSCSPPSLRSA